STSQILMRHSPSEPSTAETVTRRSGASHPHPGRGVDSSQNTAPSRSRSTARSASCSAPRKVSVRTPWRGSVIDGLLGRPVSPLADGPGARSFGAHQVAFTVCGVIERNERREAPMSVPANLVERARELADRLADPDVDDAGLDLN